MQTSGFILRRSEGICHYTCAALDCYAGLRHGFSTRGDGVSRSPDGLLNLGCISWDTTENLLENRRRFLHALGIAPECLVTAAQKHSAEFHIIQEQARQWNPRTPGDALIAAETGIAVAVLVADCFPILLFDPGTGIVAAVHAGWRGTMARILSRTLEGMRVSLGVEPARVLAAIGPGIRSCCFEVGPEVEASFAAEFPGARLCRPNPEREGKHLLDLPHALALQLSDSGVSPENVHDLGLCTRCRPHEFFSHRAEGDRAGRMMAVICAGCSDGKKDHPGEH